MIRGEIWLVRFDPVEGREQAGTRPALIVSIDKFNQGPADLAVVLPITSRDKTQPLHVRVQPPEGGLSMASFIKTEDIRSVSTRRLIERLGKVSPATLAQVELRIRTLLAL